AAPTASAAPVEPIEPAHAPSGATAHAARVELPMLGKGNPGPGSKHLRLLFDVGVDVAAVVGVRELKLEEVMAIQPGTIIALDKSAGEPIELYVNGKPIARAEIVVVDGRLGARILESLTPRGVGARRDA